MPKITKPEARPIVVHRDFPFKRGNTYFIKFPDGNGGYRDLELPAVTTILSETSDKQALIRWGMKVGATAMMENPGVSVEDAVAIAQTRQTNAIDVGKAIHKFAEDYNNHLQQMAYANAEWIYTTDPKTGKHDCIKMPTIHEQYLVHLKDNGTAHLIPVQEPFEYFLSSLKFWPTARKRKSFY